MTIQKVLPHFLLSETLFGGPKIQFPRAATAGVLLNGMEATSPAGEATEIPLTGAQNGVGDKKSGSLGFFISSIIFTLRGWYEQRAAGDGRRQCTLVTPMGA